MNSREIGRRAPDTLRMIKQCWTLRITPRRLPVQWATPRSTEHAAAAADALKAAGAGTTDAAIKSGPHQAGPGNSSTDTGHDAEHAAPNQTPPAREYDGGNSTVDTGGNATHDAPQVDSQRHRRRYRH